QETAERVGPNNETWKRSEGAAVHRRRAGGALCQFPRKLSRQVRDHGFTLFRSTTLCDFYLARRYYDQARRNVARSYDAFSRFIKLRLAEAAKAIDVRPRHRGKHLVPPGGEHRKRRHGHP